MYLTRCSVGDTFPQSSWQRIVFSEFEATLTSKSRPFPCVFGVAGLKANQLRFAFPDPLNAETLAPILKSYLSEARGIGKMTSLVVFARPGPVQGIEDYRKRFWSLLDGVESLDTTPRPAEVPDALDTDHWEFCFDGEPIFVVCNSPAHVLRQSRRSTSFMITFQPRWVFEGLMNTDDPAAKRSLDMVRERLETFDAIPPAPVLGHYGTPGNREYQQYFLDDTNIPAACPFHSMGKRSDETPVKKGKVA
ncbi:MAG: YqcI/YcgG family protein [Rhodobacteraceae bacterium]|nr:YqcI/YcgG family protein [Paracoccaceae bacterium]